VKPRPSHNVKYTPIFFKLIEHERQTILNPKIAPQTARELNDKKITPLKHALRTGKQKSSQDDLEIKKLEQDITQADNSFKCSLNLLKKDEIIEDHHVGRRRAIRLHKRLRTDKWLGYFFLVSHLWPYTIPEDITISEILSHLEYATIEHRRRLRDAELNTYSESGIFDGGVGTAREIEKQKKDMLCIYSKHHVPKNSQNRRINIIPSLYDLALTCQTITWKNNRNQRLRSAKLLRPIREIR